MFGSVRLKGNIPKNVLSPQDVNKYVQKVESKLTGTLEKKSKSFAFARMYFDAKDYQLAKRYLEDYVSVQDRDFRVFNLMGEINEALNEWKEALVAFKRSLELNSTQKDILIKVLILTKKCDIDPLRAKVWADKGAKICPGHPAVFELKWHLMQQSKTKDFEEMELLLADELSRRARDPSLHIKLVTLYNESGSHHQAAQHCQSVEKTNAFNDSIEWLECACNVFNNYRHQKDGLDTNFSFVLVLCKLMKLHLRQSSSEECLVALQKFDSYLDELKRTCSIDKRMSFGRELSDCLKEMTGQLYLNAAIYFMKLAKEGRMSWMKANQYMSTFLMACWSYDPPALTPKLFSRHSPLKRSNPQVYDWSVLACDRLSQAGHLLLLLESQFNDEWMKTQLNDFCNMKGVSMFLDCLEITAHDQSYLARDKTFFDTEVKVPNPNELVKFDEVSVAEHAQDLHWIIWLGLHWEKLNEHIKPGVGVLVGRLFEGIGLDVKNMKNCHFSSLCLRDVEAFLYAVIRSSKSLYLEGRKDEDRLFLLPVDITPLLITKAQEEWWKSAYCLYTGKMGNETIGKLKITLQKGLETIRCLRDHGIDPRILVYMATAFSEKAASIQSEKKTEYDYQDHWESLQGRAVYYLKEAIRILEIFKKNKTVLLPEHPLIPPLASPLLPEQVLSLLKTCYLKLAETSMLSGNLLDAINYYEEVNTLQALYSQVQIYTRLASQCDLESVQGEKDHLYYTKKAIEKIHVCINNADHSPEFKESLLEQLKDLQSGALSPSQSHANTTSASLKGFKKSLDFQSNDDTDDRELKAEDLASSITVDDVVSIERSMLQDQLAAKDTELATMKQYLEMYKTQLELARQQLILQNHMQSPILTPVLPTPPNLPPQMVQGMQTPTAGMLSVSPHPVSHSAPHYPLPNHQVALNNTSAVYPTPPPAPPSIGATRPLSSVPVHMQSINPNQPVNLQSVNPSQPINTQSVNPNQPINLQSVNLNQPVIGPAPLHHPPGYHTPSVAHQMQSQSVRRVNSNGSIVITPTTRNGMETPTDMWWDSFSPQPSFEKGYFAGLAEHVEQSREEMGEEEAPTMRDADTNEKTPQPIGPASNHATPVGVTSANATPSSTSPKKTSIVEYDDIYVEPIVKLESVTQTKTGEEDETVKFVSRAKLYRFDKEAGQWKERGTGEVKILTNDSTKKSRITMRRDQIFRVCCNHFITDDLCLEEKSGAKAAWTWFTPADATENETRPEQFTIKFKTQDIANEFKSAFEGCQSPSMKSPEKTRSVGGESKDATTISATSTSQVNDSKAQGANKSFSIMPDQQTFGNPSLVNSTSYPNKIAFDTTLESSLMHSIGSQSTPRFHLSSESPTIPPATTTGSFTFGSAKDVITKSPDGKPVFNFATSAPKSTPTAATVNPFLEQPQENTTVLPPFKPSEVKVEASVVTTQTPPASIPSNPFAGFSFGKSISQAGIVSSTVTTASTSSSPFSGFSFSSKPSSTVITTASPLAQTTPTKTTTGFPLMKSLLQTTTAMSETIPVVTSSPVISGMNTLPVFNKGVVSAGIDPTAFWTSVSPQKPFFTGNTTGLDKIGHQEPYQPQSEEDIEITKFQGNGKLFLYDESKSLWIEHAHGEIQILLDESSFTSRVTLYEHETYQVCCNHWLSAYTFLKNESETAVSYTISNDLYLLNGAQLILKFDFESKEKSDMFKEAVTSCQALLGAEPRVMDETEFFLENLENVSGENMYFGDEYYYGDYDDNGVENYGDNEYDEDDDYDSDDEYEKDDDNQPSTGNSSRLGSADKLYDVIDDSKQVEERFEIQRRENLPKQQDIIDDDITITYETKPSFAQKIKASRLQLPSTFYMYKSKPPCPGCRGCTDANLLAKKHAKNVSCDVKDSTLIEKKEKTPTNGTTGHVFGSSGFVSTQTFASLASPESQTGFQGASGSFAGAGALLFSNDSTVDDKTDEHDPHYDAIVQLSKVDSKKTGEEEDEVMFKHRAKLYRYDQQWKERGVGDIKLTKNRKSSYCRVIMRRDAIYKICANHAISPSMELKPLSSSDKSWVWFTPSDYSDGLPPVPQQFCVKFKNKEIADEFRKIFEELKEIMANVLENETKKTMSDPIENQQETINQEQLSPAKPSEPITDLTVKKEPSSIFSKFALKEDEWECAICAVRNKSDAHECIACQAANPNKQPDNQPTKPSFTFGQEKPPASLNTNSSPFSFGLTLSENIGQNAGSSDKSATFSGFSFGSGSTASNTTTSGFSFGAKTDNPSPFSGFTFGPSTSSDQANSPFTFGKPEENTSESKYVENPVSKSLPSETPTVFNTTPFNMGSTQFENNSPFTFTAPSAHTEVGEDIQQKKVEESIKIEQANSRAPRSPTKYDNEDDTEIHVEAIVQVSKLDSITTGEENDETLFKQRAKLFRFDSSSKQWKERGIGEMKLTRNTRDNTCRVLMRREQIHKVCANHVIMPLMELKPMPKSDKSWTWFTQADISEGDLRPEQFCIRFKTPEIASEFKNAFDSCLELTKISADGSKPSVVTDAESKGKSKITSETSKDKTTSKPSIFSKFATPSDCWVCSVCMINNSNSLQECQACSNPNPSTANKKTEEAPKFSFGMQPNTSTTLSQSATESTAIGSFGGFTFGSQGNNQSKSKEKVASNQSESWECASCLSKNKPERTECRSCNALKIKTPNVKLNPEEFSGPITFSSSNEPVTSHVLAPKQTTASTFGFSFGAQQKNNVTPSKGGFSFGNNQENQVKPTNTGFSFGTKPSGNGAGFSFGQSMFSTTAVIDPEKEKADRELMPPPQSLPIQNKTKTSPGQTQKKDSSIFSWMPKGLNTDNLFSLGKVPTPTLSAASSVDDIPQKQTADVASAFSGQSFTFKFNTPTKPIENVTSPRTPTNNIKSPVNIKSPDQVSSPTTLEEESNVEFAPLVSLQHIDRETGEECESEVFNERAKMFRFAGGQWKERGVGALKILKHRETKTCRLIMRRDQTHKLCANHSLNEGMSVKKMAGNNKAYVWKTAADNSEDVPSEEMFAARFKNEDIAENFAGTFEEACQPVMVQNVSPKEDKNAFVASPVDGVHEVIVISDDDDDDDNDDVGKHIVKEVKLPEGVEVTYENQQDDKLLKDKARRLYLPSKFYCETSSVIGGNGPVKTVAMMTAHVETGEEESREVMCPPLDLSSFNILFDDIGEILSQTSGEKLKIIFSGHVLVVTAEEKSTAKIIGKLENGAALLSHDLSKIKVDTYETSKVMASWEFIDRTASKHIVKFDSVLTLEKFLHAVSQARTTIETKNSEKTDSEPVVFGKHSGLTSFAALASTGNENAFSSNSGKSFASTGQVLFQANPDGSAENVENGEIYVEPIVQLSTVAVTSGEENEKAVFNERAKLYRFDNKEKRWKERGIGELRLLLDQATNKSRLIMRRDQTRKLCANHVLHEGMVLSPFATNELTVTWNALGDVSDGEPLDSIFAGKFKNKLLLEKFKEKFQMLCDGTFVSTDEVVDDTLKACDPTLIEKLNIH